MGHPTYMHAYHTYLIAACRIPGRSRRCSPTAVPKILPKKMHSVNIAKLRYHLHVGMFPCTTLDVGIPSVGSALGGLGGTAARTRTTPQD